MDKRFFQIFPLKKRKDGACTSPEANSRHGASHELLLTVPRSEDSTVPIPQQICLAPNDIYGLELHCFGVGAGCKSCICFPIVFSPVLTKITPGEKISIRQQVIVCWPDLMTGVVSVALAYNKGQGWKYPVGDLCRRDGSATRARTTRTPELWQHARMARGVLETAARVSKAWTPDLGQVARAGRGFLKTARQWRQGRRGHQGPGRSPGRAEVSSRRHSHRGEGRFVAWWRRQSRTYCLLAALITDVLFNSSWR